MHVQYTTSKELKQHFNSSPDLFLAAYESFIGLDRSKVKQSGKAKLRVACPFHDDKTPSAAFIRRPNGVWVYKCSAASCPASRRSRTAFNALAEYGGVAEDELLDWIARQLGTEREFAVRGQVKGLPPSPPEAVMAANPDEPIPDVEPKRYDLDYWTDVYSEARRRLEMRRADETPDALRGFLVTEALEFGLGLRRICGVDTLMLSKRDRSGRPIAYKTRYNEHAAACIRRVIAARDGIEDPDAIAAIHWPKYREHPAGVHAPWVHWGRDREVYVIEGELNAMSAAAVLPDSVTVIGLPGQDVSILKDAEYSSVLRAARRVYAYFDEHAAGQAFLEFLTSLGTWKQPYDLTKVTVIPPLGGGTDFNDVFREDRGRLEDILLSRTYVDAPSLSALDLEVPTEWAPGILRNRPALFFGPPGSHKTTFTVGYVFAALTGVSPFPGVPVNMDGLGFDRVVYVSFEEPGQVLWNLGALFNGLEAEMRRVWPEWFEHGEGLQGFFDHAREYLTLVPGQNLSGKSIGEIMDSFTRAGEHTLLVLDPFGYFLNTIGDENSAETVAAVWDAITAKTEQLADSGGSLTTLLVDHINLANFLNTIKALKEGKNPTSVAPRGNMRKLDKPRSVRMLVTYPAEGWVRPPVDVAGRSVPGVLVREEMVKNSFGGLWGSYWNLGYVELTPGQRVTWNGYPLTITRAMKIERYDRLTALAYVPPGVDVEEDGEGPVYVNGWRETVARPEGVVTTQTTTDAEELVKTLLRQLRTARVVDLDKVSAEPSTLDYAVKQLEKRGYAERRGRLLYFKQRLYPPGTREAKAARYVIRRLQAGKEVMLKDVVDYYTTREGLKRRRAYILARELIERLAEEGVAEVTEVQGRGKPLVARQKEGVDLEIYI